MKSFLLAIAAVQILHCSGVPSTKDALRASVAKLNEITEITNLCAITRRGVTNTYRTGKLSYNVDLTFSVKETVCSKNSVREFDDSGCTFRPKKIAEKGFCKSRVEYFADKVADVDVECEGLKTIDSESDSSESSETSIEVKSKSDEISLEDSSNDNTKSTETSHEHSDQVKYKSKETSIEEYSNESSNMKSKSTELSLEEPSNEQNEDSRGRH
ncbi:secreted phosphoprotein 24-like isoform X3 [Leucoraja erinacea]|uniref:secreted phosphoprotein 24-like isoform X3 n=1 Tax=Leucoraja erinaceus TaxID=7782 RepID=UPI0024573DD8|nr:secreted phosphoprotein 24-like isoform X3 [Leucoraja erinacea]